jgi:NAD(P)-dependent dehydrogenase (short-subunit alcohol dehydrogenase family)
MGRAGQGRVAGKIAIVVGGGQTPGQSIGNGRATCLVLAREGAKVVVADRNFASAQETVTMIRGESGEATAMEVDATSEESVSRLVAAAVAQYGGLHILHNNVGASVTASDMSPLEISEAAFDRMMAVNFKSAWFAARQAIPFFRRGGGGSIINISSIAARQAYPFLGYKATKTALLALTEQLAAQHAPDNIRVNAILPGRINTPMAIEPRVAAGADREQLVAARNRRVPLGGKMGTGWDVAFAALFLHSDEARFISGIALHVDGAELVSANQSGS